MPNPEIARIDELTSGPCVEEAVEACVEVEVAGDVDEETLCGFEPVAFTCPATCGVDDGEDVVEGLWSSLADELDDDDRSAAAQVLRHFAKLESMNMLDDYSIDY